MAVWILFKMSVDWDQRYLALAKEISSWSKDPSRKIGAVAVGAKGQVLAQGYNGFPRGIVDSRDRYNNRPVKYKYVVHAEMNCIYNATYNGVSLDGSIMYVWGLPMCSDCAKGVIQVGVKHVLWGTDMLIPKTWVDSLEDTTAMFREAGVKITCLHSPGSVV